MSSNTQTLAFDYELPEDRIAQYPPAQRSASRMLVVDPGGERFADATVARLPEWLRPDDLVVFNDTRVVPARMIAHRPTGGRVEILLERVLDQRRALCQLGSNKKLSPGAALVLADGSTVDIADRQDRFFILASATPIMGLFQRLGDVPLPPYIARPVKALDEARYQTVFAKVPGAVAAPTAGLHFDAALLAAIDAIGCERHTLTLHVGAGTFTPVQVADARQHQMHSEYIDVPSALLTAIDRARERRGRVVAIGTTVVRALESAAMAPADGDDAPAAFRGLTDLFIYPGFEFQAVDMLLTNFHLPKSTLLLLVCAFAGNDTVRRAYRHALIHDYRFYSYGDAMLLTCTAPATAGSV